MKTLRETRSLCPVCLRVLPARIFEEEGAIFMEKECPKHGYFRDLCWSDAELYKRFEELDVAVGKLKGKDGEFAPNCPFGCGLCSFHASPTVLGVVEVTSRCNLRCPVCFADAGVGSGRADRVDRAGSQRERAEVEPDRTEIEAAIDALASSGAVAVQFSGGEPTLREDLPELISYARKRVPHVQVDTNGLKMAESEDFCREMESAGLSVVYLQFDGVTEEPYRILRGRELLNVKKKAIENHRHAGPNPAIVLVPTVVRGVNDNQIGKIIEFAVQNSDIVRGVNFQPLSLCGRTPFLKNAEERVTVSDVVAAAVSQTKFLRKEDFFPPSVMSVFLDALGSFVGCHHACGAFTYLLCEGEKGRESGKNAHDINAEPLTKFINMNALAETFKAKGKITLATVLRSIRSRLIKEIFMDAFRSRSYWKLSELHRRLVFVGAMHFMDAFNFDFERARRCCIHYGLPDGRVVPFCSFNTAHRQRAGGRERA